MVLGVVESPWLVRGTTSRNTAQFTNEARVLGLSRPVTLVNTVKC